MSVKCELFNFLSWFSAHAIISIEKLWHWTLFQLSLVHKLLLLFNFYYSIQYSHKIFWPIYKKLTFKPINRIWFVWMKKEKNVIWLSKVSLITRSCDLLQLAPPNEQNESLRCAEFLNCYRWREFFLRFWHVKIGSW